MTKHFKRPLSILLAVLMVTSMMAVMAVTVNAAYACKDCNGTVNCEPILVIEEVGGVNKVTNIYYRVTCVDHPEHCYDIEAMNKTNYTFPISILHEPGMCNKQAVDYISLSNGLRFDVDGDGSYDFTTSNIFYVSKGSLDPNNHSTNLWHYNYKDSTYNEAGQNEYWYCYACGKYYNNADGKSEHEITHDETIIPKKDSSGASVVVVDSSGNPYRYYDTIEEALPALNSHYSIKLLKDITVTNTINISQYVTLRLNGHNITGNLPTKAIFSLTGSAQLHVYDIYDTGKIENTGSTNNNAKTIDLSGSAQLTLNSGTIKGCKKTIYSSSTDSKIYIKGGTVETSASGGHGAIYSLGYLSVSNGTISAVNDNFAIRPARLFVSGGTITGKKYAVYESSVYSDASVVIQGGTFTSTDSYPVYLSGSSCSASVKVTGGTFNAPEGFKAIGFDGSTKAYVTSDSSAEAKANTDYVFVIDGNYYGAGALNVVPSGSTLALEKDVTISGSTTFTIQNDVTLDLNGHTITHTGNATADVAAITVTGKCNVTFKDSVGTGKVTIANISGTANKGVNAVQIKKGATVNFEGGTYAVTGDNDNATVYVISSSKAQPVVVNITGGTFEGSNNSAGGANNYLINIKDDQRAYTTINVMGGTFEGFDPADNTAEGANTDFVPAGFDSQSENGEFTVTIQENPLDPINKEASEINDGNAFLLSGIDYKVGALLGVQKKTVAGEGTSNQEVEDKNIRFIAVLESSLLRAADDYGFVLAKVNPTGRTYKGTKFDNLKVGTEGSKNISAKGTFNNVCGNADYGNPTANTPYKYITCAVNGMSNDDMVVARFWVKINGKYYYAKYAGHSYQYTGCMTKADLSNVPEE